MPDFAVALVHSPLCGPSTWSGLAPVLSERGWTVVVPDLIDDGRPPCFAAGLRAELAGGGRFPAWSPDDLRELVPDPEEFVADQRPRGLDYFAEPIAVPADWPVAPCGYLHVSAPYDGSAAQAAALGWPVVRVNGAGHFHMLMDPVAVADALEQVVVAMGAAQPASPA